MDRVGYAFNRFQDHFFNFTFSSNVLFYKSTGHC